MVELFDTDRNIWNQFASLPVGVHVLECNMEKVAHIRRIANRYNALYEKTYGRTQHNSGWAVILTNRDFCSGCRLIIVDHTRIFKEEIRMGRPSDPNSLRAIVMEACKKANETGIPVYYNIDEIPKPEKSIEEILQAYDEKSEEQSRLLKLTFRLVSKFKKLI